MNQSYPHCQVLVILPEIAHQPFQPTLASPPLAAFTQLARHFSGRLHWAFNWCGLVPTGPSLIDDAESSFDDNKDNIDRFFERHPKLDHIALHRAVNHQI